MTIQEDFIKKINNNVNANTFLAFNCSGNTLYSLVNVRPLEYLSMHFSNYKVIC